MFIIIQTITDANCKAITQVRVRRVAGLDNVGDNGGNMHVASKH
jgi:hypothetical protein